MFELREIRETVERRNSIWRLCGLFKQLQIQIGGREMGGHQRSSEYMTGGSRTRMADRKIVLLALDYRRTPFISGERSDTGGFAERAVNAPEWPLRRFLAW